MSTLWPFPTWLSCTLCGDQASRGQGSPCPVGPAYLLRDSSQQPPEAQAPGPASTCRWVRHSTFCQHQKDPAPTKTKNESAAVKKSQSQHPRLPTLALFPSVPPGPYKGHSVVIIRSDGDPVGLFLCKQRLPLGSRGPEEAPGELPLQGGWFLSHLPPPSICLAVRQKTHTKEVGEEP